ncbi:hydrogenase nickel incorporation protein HypB [Chloroflexota bacterium]
MEIKVLKGILDANEAIAARNRDRLDRDDTLTVNVMSSPGAGKTSLVLQIIEKLKPEIKIAVIEGDIASSVDADKVSKHGVPVIQINTEGGCHLDANMIENALNNLSLGEIDLLLIENVGNLVCPAEFALGEHCKVMLLSTPEGDDKPYKYPLMFTESDVILVNKIDLLPYLDFNTDAFTSVVTGLNPDVKIYPISCKTGEGMETWFLWLKNEIKQIKSRQAAE